MSVHGRRARRWHRQAPGPPAHHPGAHRTADCRHRHPNSPFGVMDCSDAVRNLMSPSASAALALTAAALTISGSRSEASMSASGARIRASRADARTSFQREAGNNGQSSAANRRAIPGAMFAASERRFDCDGARTADRIRERAGMVPAGEEHERGGKVFAQRRFSRVTAVAALVQARAGRVQVQRGVILRQAELHFVAGARLGHAGSGPVHRVHDRLLDHRLQRGHGGQARTGRCAPPPSPRGTVPGGPARQPRGFPGTARRSPARGTGRAG